MRLENEVDNLQNGDTITGKVLDLLIPAGNLEGRRITPRVVVEGEEVAALVTGTAVHVFGHLETVGVNISGGVSDGNLAVSTASNVLSHITSDGLDIGCSRGSSIIIDNLVTGEESQCVRVVCERINGGKDVLQVDGVVGWRWGGSVERVERCVDIQHQVHACGSQR